MTNARRVFYECVQVSEVQGEVTLTEYSGHIDSPADDEWTLRSGETRLTADLVIGDEVELSTNGETDFANIVRVDTVESDSLSDVVAEIRTELGKVLSLTSEALAGCAIGEEVGVGETWERPNIIEVESEDLYSPASLADVELSAKRLLKYTGDTVEQAVPSQHPHPLWDIITLALAAERIDPILQALRYREPTRDILARLAKSVELLTTLGEKFGLEVDGEPVKASTDFSKWSVDRLRRLAIGVYSFARSVTDREVEKQEFQRQLAETRTNLETAKAKIAADAEKIVEDATTAEGRVELVRESVRAANKQLGEYKDQQDFVVARVDPDSGVPLRYFVRVDEGHVKTIPNMRGGTQFSRFRDAHAFQAEITRGIRARAKIGVLKEDGTEHAVSFPVRERTATACRCIVVMQVNLRAVTSRDMR